VFPHPQARASSAAKSTSGNLSPSPHDEKQSTCKTLSSSGFLLGGLYVPFLGIIPYFLQYTDVILTRKKKGKCERRRTDE
jgi:hypothetical protein